MLSMLHYLKNTVLTCKISMGNTNYSILIFTDKIKVKNGHNKFVLFQNCPHFWETCGEDDIKLPRGCGRMDPVLRLHFNCRVMLPSNICVREGQANGTLATFQNVVLKHGTIPTTVELLNGLSVKGVLASDVDHILLKHSNDKVCPQKFSVQPLPQTFTTKILKPTSLQSKGKEREKFTMQARQLPLISNDATTGHKLQGSGVENLFVHSWKYVTNWPYVMLSHVGPKNSFHVTAIVTGTQKICGATIAFSYA